MADAVEVHGLVKRYGDFTAVDHVDFTVARGSVFAFLGPNGAGKTTTTEILEGIRRQTEGSVRVLGLDPWGDGYELHRKIGVIPQDFRFFDKITPAEAVAYYASLFGTRADPADLMRRVQLTEKADAQFETLSGGQKQKLGLALALTSDPQVCFLDEPTTGLDPQARRGIWEVIRTLRGEGRTVFLTTHYLEEAELLADRVAIIHQGRIIASGTPADIIRAHGRPERLVVEAGPELATYLSSHLHVDATFADHHVETPVPTKEDVLRVLAAIRESGLPWDHVATAQDTLEDVFVRLVGKMDDGALRSGAAP
jgi:ABC-2 type transport system ATP-binding protein